MVFKGVPIKLTINRLKYCFPDVVDHPNHEMRDGGIEGIEGRGHGFKTHHISGYIPDNPKSDS